MEIEPKLVHSHQQIQPVKFPTDFEKALMQGIEFPTAKVKGCFYLFAQAIWEKFKQLAIKIATKKSKIPENSSKR